MLYFSEAGLQELHSLVQQVAPYINSKDHARLVAITSTITRDGAILQKEYERLVAILEPYTAKRCLKGRHSHLCERLTGTVLLKRDCKLGEDGDAKILAIRYYLLSYSGIADWGVQPIAHQSQKVIRQEMGDYNG